MTSPDTVAAVGGESPSPRPAVALALFVLLGVAMFAIRLTGAPNLLDNEYRVGACVLDVLQHHNWLCPHDVLGNTDKPPMLTWLAAIASTPSGKVTPLTLYLPTAIATVATAWIVLAAASRWFGARAGFFAGLAYLLSHAAAQQMATARWDGVFTLTVAATAVLAFRAWTTGGGWTAAWLAGAAATLTKGPLGILLAAFGLLAVPWERRSGRARPLEGAQAPGVALFLAITVGWFALAYRQVGPHLIDNMIRGEFVGNIVEHEVGYRFWKPIGDFIADFFPWSLLALWGAYRIVTTPAAGDDARRLERFAFCWLVAGLVLFTVSPHNQARLLEPMFPAAALIAGREMDGLVRRFGWVPIRVAAVATVVALGTFAFEYHRVEYRKPEVRRTMELLRLAGVVRRSVGETFPLAYVQDSPFAMQLALNTMYPTVTFDEAASLLRGDAAAFVVVTNVAGLRRALGSDASRLQVLGQAAESGHPFLWLVGNRPRLGSGEPVATRVGPLRVTLTNAGLASAWDGRLAIAPGAAAGTVLVENAGDAALPVAVHLPAGDAVRVLAPSDRWRIEVPAVAPPVGGGER